VLLGVALLPFACWQLRNAATPLARTGGERAIASISHGSYPGMVFRDERFRGFPYREDPEQPAFGASWQNLGDVLARRVAADPWRYASWYLFEKPVWLWSFDLVQGRGPLVYEVANSPYDTNAVVGATAAAMRWLHVPVMLLAAAGALIVVLRPRLRDGGAPRLLGFVAVLGTIVYLPVIPDPRYLQPIRPVLFVLAAAAANGVFVWLVQRCSASASSPGESAGDRAAPAAATATTSGGAPPNV
jgi:hypothetical protein